MQYTKRKNWSNVCYKKHIHNLRGKKYSCGLLKFPGYPAQDYDSNQIPRKTELCLSLSGQDFEKYISEVLYPNLAGKKFDIYKIDKQRRLIRLAKYTPRAIKDSKYQGSLIIIPYVGILIQEDWVFVVPFRLYWSP